MKKFFSLVLALVMALSLTTVAWGADLVVDPNTPTAAPSYQTLAEAVAAVPDGTATKITLLDDVALTGTIEIAANKDITIEGNGFTISNATGDVFKITGGGKLTLGAGLNVHSETDCAVWFPNPSNGTLISSANLSSNSPNYATITGNGTAGHAGTSITINGGSVTSAHSGAIYHPQTGTLTINGGTVSGYEAGIAMKSGTLTVAGGSVICTGPDSTPTTGYSNGVNASGAAIQIESNDDYVGGVEVSITGGTVKSNNGAAIYEYVETSTADTAVDSVSISGGTVAGKIMISSELAADDSVAVSGGTFTDDVSAYVAPGYSFVNGQIVASTKTWTDKYFTMTSADATVYDGVTLEYTAPVALTYDADTGLVNNVANVAYYYIPEWNDLYVEVGTIGEADVVAYNTKVDGKATGLFKYLKLVDNVSYIGNGVAFNDFGKACGQYKAVPTVDTKYYLFEDTVYQGVATSDTCLMVGSKLVPVIALPDLFVDHVASYTYNDKFEVTAVKCSECGCVANIVPNYVSLPAGVTGYGPINDTMYYYWPAAAAVVTPSTDKVQSAETFDAGIAMYVGMSVMAAAGSAVVIGKKKD